jgi:hypothetical protein
MSVARDTAFQARVRFCLTTAAIAVMAEVNTTANHAVRVTYAKTVIAGTADVYAAAVAVVTNSTIAAEANPTSADQAVPDGDLQFTVNSLFNALSGVAT